jgi:hypothetical protein
LPLCLRMSLMASAEVMGSYQLVVSVMVCYCLVVVSCPVLDSMNVV